MSAVTAEPLPVRDGGRPFTVADLDAMPDDGRRHELVDGVLLVTPAPGLTHQLLVGELYLLLMAAAPADLRVVLAPYDVDLAIDTRVQPDLLVARRTDLTERGLPVAPVLAVEVLSPSTRRIDLGTKRSVYEEAGTAAYWVVDPRAPRLRAWELRGGGYVEVADVSGDEAYDATLPFPVRVVPSRLAAKVPPD